MYTLAASIGRISQWVWIFLEIWVLQHAEGDSFPPPQGDALILLGHKVLGGNILWWHLLIQPYVFICCSPAVLHQFISSFHFLFHLFIFFIFDLSNNCPMILLLWFTIYLNGMILLLYTLWLMVLCFHTTWFWIRLKVASEPSAAAHGVRLLAF